MNLVSAHISRKQTHLKKKKIQNQIYLMNSVTNIHSKLLRNRNTPMYRSPNNIYLFKLRKFEEFNRRGYKW